MNNEQTEIEVAEAMQPENFDLDGWQPKNRTTTFVALMILWVVALVCFAGIAVFLFQKG